MLRPSFRMMTDFTAFLADAAAHRLLGPAEEQRLAKITWPVFSKDDTPEAVPPLRDGKHVCGRCEACRARHELVLCNIRLVVSIARYFRGRELPSEDVIQEGIIGLDRAATKFDPNRRIRFSTYGTLWIRQAIQRALLGRGSTIRLPSAVASNRAKVRDKMRTGHSSDVLALASELDMAPGDVERALAAAEVVTSLDRELTTDEYTHTLLDALPDPYADDPLDLIREDTSELYDALDQLESGELHPKYGAKHRLAVELRFGLDGGGIRKYDEVAAIIDSSKNTAKTYVRESMEVLKEALVPGKI